MQARGHILHGALQQEDAVGLQGFDDLQPLLGGQAVRRDAQALQFPIDGVDGHRLRGVAKLLRRVPGGRGGGAGLRGGGHHHILHEDVRMAQPHDLVADGSVAAVVEIDA